MLGIRFTGHRGLLIEQFPDPKPKDTQVVIRVRASAICGSDREPWEEEGQKTIPGHEVAGEVVAVDRPSWLRIGDRVAVNCHITCGQCYHCRNGDLYFCPALECIGSDRHGGDAEFLLIPEASCMPLPDDLSYDAGALIVDMLGTSYHAVKRLAPLPGARIGVFGAGPIGLTVLLIAKLYGAQVLAIDPNQYRLNMAQRLGADLIVDPHERSVIAAVADWTHGKGLDAAFECAGNEHVTQQALDAVKNRGTVVLVGVNRRATINPWDQLIRKEVTIFGSRNLNTHEYEEMVTLVRWGLRVEEIITHRFSLQQAEEAFAIFGSGQCGKIVFHP